MLLLHPLAVSLLGLKLHLVYLSLQALDQRSLLLSLLVPHSKFPLHAIELLSLLLEQVLQLLILASQSVCLLLLLRKFCLHVDLIVFEKSDLLLETIVLLCAANGLLVGLRLRRGVL